MPFGLRLPFVKQRTPPIHMPVYQPGTGSLMGMQQGGHFQPLGRGVGPQFQQQARMQQQALRMAALRAYFQQHYGGFR